MMTELGYSIETSAVERKLSDSHDKADNSVFVAVLEDAIVGVLSIHAVPLLHIEGMCATITSLFVAPHCRRQGIGSQLLAHAEAFAFKSGCTGINVASAHHRTDAHAFYKAHGFTPDAVNVHFRKKIRKAEQRQKYNVGDATASS
jgi:GNAT superfamily N-acetyltransferase